MSITDFMNEFNISNEDSIGFVISNKFIKKNSIDEDEIITKLEKYDIPVLKHIKKSMRKDSQDLYEKIMKRRDAYIDRERRIHEIKKEQNILNGLHDNSSESEWIDYTDDQDDTKNLVCGMNVTSNGIDKINLIIKNKKQKIEIEENKKQRQYYNDIAVNILMVGAQIFMLAKILF